MIIKTKFKINDSVFYMYMNKLVEDKVKVIKIGVFHNMTTIYYDVDISTSAMKEEELYASKEEALATL